jgi:hypothetical protein
LAIVGGAANGYDFCTVGFAVIGLPVAIFASISATIFGSSFTSSFAFVVAAPILCVTNAVLGNSFLTYAAFPENGGGVGASAPMIASGKLRSIYALK